MASGIVGITPEKAIEAYVALAKSTRGKTTASGIREALSNPNTFVFAELLDVPSVKEVSIVASPDCLLIISIIMCSF